MRNLLLLTLVLFGTLLAADDRDFKQQYTEGLKFLAAGKREDAIVHLKEAYNLNNKAQLYKVEGTYFEPYMPRYKLAIAFETIDADEALKWANLSKEAREFEILKKGNEKANYNNDLDRIAKSAETSRTEKKRSYDIKLSQAQSLLDNKKFSDAKAAFEALAKLDSSRTEAKLGLESINRERSAYLRELSLDAQSATLNKDWPKVEAALAKIESVDNGYAELPGLRAAYKSAKDQSLVASAPVKESVKNPPPKEPVRTVSVPERRTAPETTTPSRETSTAPLQAQTNVRGKDNVRRVLLASLQEYRRGNPQQALKVLNGINAKEGELYASYHWLRGVYLLQINAQSGKNDEALLKDAGTAMARVAELLPNFQPEERLYPAFVLSFYKEHHP